MSFFRRNEDSAKIRSAMPHTGMSHMAEVRSAVTAQPASAAAASVTYGSEITDYEAFGSALEENKQSSEELLSDLAFLQERVSSLLGAHKTSLNEVGLLRAECARLASLLEYESGARRKLEQDNIRLAAENKNTRTDNSQLRIEADAIREEFVKLQATHAVMSEEFTIIETRLLDAERELVDRASQYDEATNLLRRTQQELDTRSRELSTTRERLDQETTAHQLLAETSRRENGVQVRELARLNEERSQLKSNLNQQEAQARNLQSITTSLKQELSLYEEKYNRLQAEFENLQTTSALEAAHLTTRHEAVVSKAELIEKLLATANGRNKMTDEELQTVRAELKRVKAEMATAQSRSERLEDEVLRARALATENEAARRELATQCGDLTVKLREVEGLRSKRDRETEILKRDLDTRADSDRYEISQLRTGLEIAKSEIRQLRTERAILTGQLEVARGERGNGSSQNIREQDEQAAQPVATSRYVPAQQPVIDISEKSLRGHSSLDAIAGDLTDMDGNEPAGVPPAE